MSTDRADAEMVNDARYRYTSSVSLAKMVYGGDLREWVAAHRPGVTIDTQTDGPVSFAARGDSRARPVTVVRAPMGSGKTTALIEWLRRELRFPDKSVLVVSCRRSFTRTLAARFNDAGLEGFVTYFTSADYIMRGRPFRRLLVQIESLHRVEKSLADDYDVLVLDEVMSTLGQLFSPTMRRLTAVDALLSRLLHHCPKVIAMDATANAQLVDLMADARGPENVHVILGEYSSPGFSDRSCTLLRRLGVDAYAECVVADSESQTAARIAAPGRDESPKPPQENDAHQRPAPNTFFSELARRLAGGLNVCIFSSTLTFSEAAAGFCSRFTKSILVLNSLRPPAEVNTWKDYRVVIYTTVVTVGLSFDDPHFHSMFAYVKPMMHGPDMVSVYQSLGRVRQLRLNEVVVYVDGSGARNEPVFAPMLLNHCVGAGPGGEGWPAWFSQVTNLLCCRFREKCATALSDGALRSMYLFPKLRYKHFFERCTLNSLCDSVNILHTLLEANRVRVSLAGCPPTPDPESFYAFLADLRADSLASKREFRALKAACARQPVPAEAEVADSEDVAAFSEKYLRLTTTPTEMADLLRSVTSPATREHFVNAVMLEACRRVPMSLHSEVVFRRLYDHYASGVIPTLTEDGSIETVVLVPDVNVMGRWRLFRLCVGLADAVGWDPASGGSAEDVTPERILELLSPYYDEFAQLLMEIPRCNITDAGLMAQRPVREVQAALSGWKRRRVEPMSRADHAVSVFRVIWSELFGAYVSRSTRTFPGGTKVKNLRKDEIVRILDSANIDHASCRTFKQLYSLLMANKKAFAGVKFTIKSPKWSRFLRTSTAEDTSRYDAGLERVLAEIPAEIWPVTPGAFGFTNIA